jgi:hypothetical protein
LKDFYSDNPVDSLKKKNSSYPVIKHPQYQELATVLRFNLDGTLLTPDPSE